jgi:hypothetical protein
MQITLEINHTLSPVEIFDLPSASLADNEPVPTDGSTASDSNALLITVFSCSGPDMLMTSNLTRIISLMYYGMLKAGFITHSATSKRAVHQNKECYLQLLHKQEITNPVSYICNNVPPL